MRQNYGLDQTALLKTGHKVRVLDVYGGGRRLVKVTDLLAPLVIPIPAFMLLPDNLHTYLIEHEQCTPNEATKLMRLWHKRPEMIPSTLHAHYKEQLK